MNYFDFKLNKLYICLKINLTISRKNFVLNKFLIKKYIFVFKIQKFQNLKLINYLIKKNKN